MLSGALVDRWLAASATNPVTRSLWRVVERFTLPGIMAHYCYRKRAIEERCRHAIALGVQRVVILGAGFGTLAMRLVREMSGIDFVEIDHPATQLAKTLALAKAGEVSPKNLQYFVCNRAIEPIPPEVFGDGKTCLVIMEGLLMYLPPAEVARLFDELHKLAQGPLRIIFSFMATWPDGHTGFPP